MKSTTAAGKGGRLQIQISADVDSLFIFGKYLTFVVESASTWVAMKIRMTGVDEVREY